MKKLPIAVSSFEVMRSTDYLYVDKTHMLEALTSQGRYFFLSRPRRFGKSLLLDTMHQLFEGKRELFRGLHIEPNWDWSVCYPVIRLDFGSGTLKSPEELKEKIGEMLRHNVNRLQIRTTAQTSSGVLAELIEGSVKQYGQKAVVLIDEYDKPILDNIENDPVAQAMRDGLKNLYSVLKTQDAHLRFVFMTGVSKFSKVSLFSGLNQLEDISLDERFATICGYTHHDLQTLFADHLAGVDWAKLKQWYNGYNFLGEPVYNPYDILLFISKGHSYRNYWFETGSPSFLMKLFKQQQYFLPELSDIEVGEEILDNFDVEHIDPVTLLYQSGYLTIKETRRRMNDQLFFVLTVPNQEVQQALNTHLAGGYAQHGSPTRASLQFKLFDALNEGDIAGLEQHIKALFAGIPWRNYTYNELADSEGFYASVLYAFFASLNASIRAEDISNHGQTDLTIELGDFVYVMEIKRDTSPDYVAGEVNPALEQIQQRGYSAKYVGQGKTVFEVGMVFNTHQRNLVQFSSKQA
ncbi:ATP-binding protein [Salinibius halmophilus]|uniref:ATP-binding protein n=1 Tax=Salinibius halmophilus TaxID=1853216 RepID=UPI000E664CF6|nr:ATP-binding protein [Salinibius halmophilus]